MRLWPDYKKQFRAFSILGLLVLQFFLFGNVWAETASELRDKINQKDQDIERLEKEIATYQSQLNDLASQKNSLASALKELDITKKKLSTDISVTERKIDKTNLNLKSLGRDISNKEVSISNSLEAIGSSLRGVDQLESTSLISTLLSEDNFTTIWDDIDNLSKLRDTTRENLNQLRQAKSDLEDTRQVTIDAKNELLALQSQLYAQHKIVEQNVAEKNKLLKETQNSEANYQQLLASRIAQKEAFESELADFESQLKFIRDPSKLPKKGALSWPLEKIFVTSPFGPRGRGFHSGTDFRASVGTPVMAVADGVVGGVGDTDLCCPGASFGKWIFIEHNNGLSTAYGHLSLISVKKGQKVKRGAVIGYSGNTGSSTGPHLHLTVYISSGVEVTSFASKSYPGKTLYQPIAAKEAYLDPMNYLPAYNP